MVLKTVLRTPLLVEICVKIRGLTPLLIEIGVKIMGFSANLHGTPARIATQVNCIEHSCDSTRRKGYGEKFGHASVGQRGERPRHIPALVRSAALRKKSDFIKFHSDILRPHFLVEKTPDFGIKRAHSPHPPPPPQPPPPYPRCNVGI